MATQAWADTIYPGSTIADLIDDKHRDIRVDIRERLVLGGHKMPTLGVSGAVSVQDGKHCVGVDSTPNTDVGTLTMAWDFAGTVARIVHFGGSHATRPDETEFPGEVHAGPSSDKVLGGIATGTYHRYHIFDALPVAASFVSFTIRIPKGAPDQKLVEVGYVCATRPDASQAALEVRRRSGPVADSQERYITTGNTQLGTDVLLTNASSDFATVDATFTDTISAEDELTFRWDTVNNIQEVTIWAMLQEV